MKLRNPLAIGCLTLALPVFASSPLDPAVPLNDVEDRVPEAWVESDYTLPPFPQEENLVQFSVDGAPTTKSYVDKTSISIGTKDNVVRYALVVKSSGGAINISYEGVRCDSNEYRIYATGTQEKTWSKPRVSEWRPFKIHNWQQKSLANYFFCPGFDSIKTVQEGLNALRLGMHPVAAQRMNLNR